MKTYFTNPETFVRLHEGPMGPYLDSFAAELRAEGYTDHAAKLQIRLVADFSHWLASEGVSAEEITPDHGRHYLSRRARYRRPHRREPATLKRLVNLLRRLEVIPEALLPMPTAVAHLQDQFRYYLQKERALAASTLIAYGSFVGEFLVERFDAGPVDVSSLRAADVTGFVQRRAASLHSQRVQVMTTALRSFLRFARYRGDLTLDLAACVPAVANWSLSSVPKALPPDQVRRALTSCDRQTVVGRRDYAMLLLLARLGLRAAEVATLTLEDLDWQAGVITVTGKMGRCVQLPLPKDVGEALAAYLQYGRPQATSRRVFLRGRAPVAGFKSHHAVGAVVKQALARAAIDSPRKGAHQFRHALACQMLRQGASLGEIGELLRHRSPQTTAIYAKVDLSSLRTLALPWPGGAR